MDMTALKMVLGTLMLDNLLLREERDKWRSTALQLSKAAQEPASSRQEAESSGAVSPPPPTPESPGS